MTAPLLALFLALSVATPPTGVDLERDAGGISLAVVGAVAIAVGLFNFCLLGPVFGVTLMGRPLK